MEYNFQFDEMHQVGADHAELKRANEYDQKMQKFRNYKKEANEIARLIGINNQMCVLDMGAGTGALSLEIAEFCKEITAVDVSTQMLQHLKRKAKKKNISNIRTVNAGFLTFNNKGRKFDRIISNATLHHLPDFWKCVALRRMHSMLADDGLFYLNDIVFSFELADYREEMNSFLEDLAEKTDADFVKDGILHFKEEFSTFDYLLDAIIGKAGFGIKTKNKGSTTAVFYILQKAENHKKRGAGFSSSPHPT